MIAKHIITMLVLAACGTGTWAQATTSPASLPASQPGTISCTDPAFTLDVPAGFQETSMQGDGVLYAFMYLKDKRVGLFLARLSFEFTQPLTEKQTGPIDRAYTLPWQGKDIYVYQKTQPHHSGQSELVVLSAAVPTKGNGLVVQMIGPKSCLATMESLMPQVLAGLQVPQKSTSGGLDSTKATLLLILGMVVVILTLRRHQIVKKRQQEQDEARRKAAWGDGPAQ